MGHTHTQHRDAKTAPFVAKLEEGEPPALYEGTLMGGGIASLLLKDWVDGNSLPLLSAFAAHNFRRLGEMGKLLVIGTSTVASVCLSW